MKKIDAQKNAIKTEADQRYQQLIEQQSLEAQERFSKIDDVNVTKPKLVGIKHLYVFFVRPPSVKDGEITPLINKLTKFSTSQFDSLYSMHTYLTRESLKYKSKPFSLVIHIEPKIEELLLDQVGDISEYWGRDIYSAHKLQDQFSAILDSRQIKLNNENHALFIYFDDSNVAINGATDSFYDKKKFRSFSDELQHRAYVNAYSFSTDFAPYLVEIVIHETLHLFGAKDKYVEDAFACEEIGRGQPDKAPIHPQQTTDIMCGLLERSLGKFARANFLKNEIVVNRYTASEIGWIEESK